MPHDRSFKDLKLLPVKELVFYGVDEDAAPLALGGVHLRPKEYHAKMQEKDTVIIDVRNSYEAEIGKFIGQEKDGGGKCLTSISCAGVPVLGYLWSCFTVFFFFFLLLSFLTEPPEPHRTFPRNFCFSFFPSYLH